MGASSAPRRQNCRGWVKMPFQGWETLPPRLTCPIRMDPGAESHHTLLDKVTGGMGTGGGLESKVE